MNVIFILYNYYIFYIKYFMFYIIYMERVPVVRPPPLALNRARLMEIFPNDYATRYDMDLSYKNIVSIDPNTFTGLNFLVTIRLEYNSIEEIQSRTFVGLRSLTMIYLNFNRIARLSSNSFDNLGSLIEINLNRNSIATLVNPSTFMLLPHVQRINLNGNTLAQIDITAFTDINPRVQLLLLGQRFNLGNIPAVPGQAELGNPEPVQPALGQPAPALLLHAAPYIRLCEICYENPVNRVMPCGHPICFVCFNQLPPSGAGTELDPRVRRCPTCRAPAPHANPLFLNGGYKKKYLKYKEKYIQLKNQL